MDGPAANLRAQGTAVSVSGGHSRAPVRARGAQGSDGVSQVRLKEWSTVWAGDSRQELPLLRADQGSAPLKVTVKF